MAMVICEQHGQDHGRIVCVHVADAIERDQRLDHVTQADEWDQPTIICLECKSKVDAFFALHDKNDPFRIEEILDNNLEPVCRTCFYLWEKNHQR